MKKNSSRRLKDTKAEFSKMKLTDPFTSHPGLNHVQRINWNDGLFKQKYFTRCRISKKIELESALHASGAFLNWYVSGEHNGSSKMVFVWLGVVYGMKIPRTNQTLISADVWADESVTRTLKLPTSTTRMADFSYESDEHPEISQADVAEWYTFLFDILESTKEDAATAANKQNLVNYIGFLALKLLRLSSKDPETVSNHIYERTTGDFENFWGLNLKIGNSYPPHSSALNDFSAVFDRYSSQSTRCLAPLVYSYGNAPAKHRSLVRNILRAGCLSTLEKIGLGCLVWTQKAAAVLNMSIYRLMDHMPYNDYNAETMKVIRELLPEDKGLGVRQYSWPWAGMFSRGAFVELQTKINDLYAATMIAIIVDCNADDPMWEIPQLKRLKRWTKERALRLAKAIALNTKNEDLRNKESYDDCSSASASP